MVSRKSQPMSIFYLICPCSHLLNNAVLQRLFGDISKCFLLCLSPLFLAQPLSLFQFPFWQQPRFGFRTSHSPFLFLSLTSDLLDEYQFISSVSLPRALKEQYNTGQ
jgi:hypothetical protein